MIINRTIEELLDYKDSFDIFEQAFYEMLDSLGYIENTAIYTALNKTTGKRIYIDFGDNNDYYDKDSIYEFLEKEAIRHNTSFIYEDYVVVAMPTVAQIHEWLVLSNKVIVNVLPTNMHGDVTMYTTSIWLLKSKEFIEHPINESETKYYPCLKHGIILAIEELHKNLDAK